MFLLVLLYVAARKGIHLSEKMMYVMVIAADIVVLFALIQFLGADPFALLTDLKTDKVNNFLSTFGNTAVYGQYLTLVFPAAMYLYCVTEKIFPRVIYGISCLLGTVGVLISNTDGTFLGFGIAIFVLVMLVSNKRAMFLRFLEIVAIDAVSAFFFGKIYGICSGARTISRLGRIAMTGKGCILLLTLVVVAWLVCFFLIKAEKFYRFLCYSLRIIIVALGVLVIGTFIYFSAINRTSELGGLDHYLRFSKEWGTERGYVWTWLWNIFLDAPFYQKLFGAGQGSVVLELFTYYSDEMINGLGYYFDNAHNVYLHYLTTIGIFGCVSYLGVFVTSVLTGLKKEHTNLQKAFLAALIAYGIQDIFCILQPITMPYVFLLFAVLQGKTDKAR